MATARPLFVGFSSASRQARAGDLEVTVETEDGPRTFVLPWFFVRQVDALLERWRREEHESTLLAMHDAELGVTLCEAARAGGLLDTTFLLAAGAPVNYEHVFRTALERSASNGHLSVATLLLNNGSGRIQSALGIATERGHAAIAALLLDRGADLHALSDTPLRNAAQGGHVDTVRLLLDRGAHIHARNDKALRVASRFGHEAVVALLLERGANADVIAEGDVAQ